MAKTIIMTKEEKLQLLRRIKTEKNWLVRRCIEVQLEEQEQEEPQSVFTAA